MRRLFIDTMVLAYAMGDEHEQREPCRVILTAAAAGRAELHASVEAIQELLFHRLRRVGRPVAVDQARTASRLLVRHAFDDVVLARAFDLVESSEIRGRDAVHAATALSAGFDGIVTTDAVFGAVPGLAVVPPGSALSSG